MKPLKQRAAAKPKKRKVKPKQPPRPPGPPAFLSSLPRPRDPNAVVAKGRAIDTDQPSPMRKPPISEKHPTATRTLPPKPKVPHPTYDQQNAARLPATVGALPSRSMSALQQMWINLLPNLTGKPYSKVAHALRVALIAEWSRRTQIAITDPDHFDWPSTDAPGGTGGLNADGWHGLGMFSFLGYRVGVTQGVVQPSRRHILETIFAEPLPPLNGLAYWREWGEPGTAMRLQKMAETLAANVRNAKRRQSVEMGAAIEEWESDLRFLYSTYYVGHFRFGWPTL